MFKLCFILLLRQMFKQRHTDPISKPQHGIWENYKLLHLSGLRGLKLSSNVNLNKVSGWNESFFKCH